MKTKLLMSRPATTTAVLFACWCWTAAQSAVAAEDLVAFSPDQTHVAAAGGDGRIYYRRSSNDIVQHTFYICQAQVLAFSGDGKLLAAAGGRNGSQGKIKVWRISDHKQLCEVVISCEGARTAALATDGSLVVAASSNGSVGAWRVSDGKPHWSRNISAAAQAIHFAPKAKGLLIQCADGTERLLDPANGRNLVQAKATKE